MTDRSAPPGDRPAEQHLLDDAYELLRGIASSFMRQERPAHILQPTALVHEAYLKMARTGDDRWESQAQFVGYAARAMRQVLVDFARRANAAKRRGEVVRWTVSSLQAAQQLSPDDYLGLHQALDRLAERQPAGARQARVVELVWLGGMSMEEAAGELRISRRQANRDWAFARIWLERELTRD